MTKIEKDLISPTQEQEESYNTKSLKVESERILRVPSVLALSNTSILQFPDEFSQDLAKFAMEAIFVYCQKRKNGEYPAENFREFELHDVKVYINNQERRISALSITEFEEYFKNLGKLGVVSFQYNLGNSKKGIVFNLFGILSYDYNLKKIYITPEGVAEILFKLCQHHEIEENKLAEILYQHTAVLKEWEDYEIPEIGYKPNKSNKIRGFYTIKILFFIFRYAKEGRFSLEAEMLKEVLGAKEKVFKFFSQYMLKPSLATINRAYPWMNLSIEYIKKHPRDSRVITHLDFRFQAFTVHKENKRAVVEFNSGIQIEKGYYPNQPTKSFLYCKNHETGLIDACQFGDLAYCLLSAAFSKVHMYNSSSLFDKEKQNKYKNFYLTDEDFINLVKRNGNYLNLVGSIRFFYSKVRANQYEKYLHDKIDNPKAYILEAIANGFFDQDKLLKKKKEKTAQYPYEKQWEEIIAYINSEFIQKREILNKAEFERYFLSLEPIAIEDGDEGKTMVVKINNNDLYITEEKYSEYLIFGVRAILGKKAQLEYDVYKDDEQPKKQEI